MTDISRGQLEKLSQRELMVVIEKLLLENTNLISENANLTSIIKLTIKELHDINNNGGRVNYPEAYEADRRRNQMDDVAEFGGINQLRYDMGHSANYYNHPEEND